MRRSSRIHLILSCALLLALTAALAAAVNPSIPAGNGIALATGSLKGQVRVAGTPISIEGATVEAFLGGQLMGSATTDADGIYTIPDLPPGSYIVRASKTGYIAQDKWNILVTAGQTTFVNFNLQVSGRLKGQVRDRATGAPIIGASVAARVGNALRLLAITTAPYGIYEVTSNLAPGTYVLAAAKSGYLPQVKKGIVIIAGKTTFVNFALERIPVLTGQVRDRLTGAPIIGATVDAYQKGAKIASAVTVPPFGIYTFGPDSLPPGIYDLTASAPGYLPQTKTNIVIGATATTYVNFALQPAVPGKWSVTENGDVLEIAYGSGADFPQYGALHLDSSYLRLTYGPDGGWGTSVILVPPFWSGGIYYQGAPIVCKWEVVGANLVLHIAGVSGGLGVAEEVVIFPPASNAIAAAVSVALTPSVPLDVRPGEAFKPVMLSSMHVSADQWDAQSAFVGPRLFPIPDSGWIISPLDAIAGQVFGLNGGTSAWKTNAPTVMIALDVPRQMCGWVTASSDPNDDNVGLWAASDAIIPSYHYIIVAKAP
jgi:hypothetical protein